jgi:hypothetical protein
MRYVPCVLDLLHSRTYGDSNNFRLWIHCLWLPLCAPLEGQYVVGHVKVSAPEWLGDVIHTNAYYSAHTTDDMTGMQLLVNFLTHSKTVEPPSAIISVTRHTPLMIPALLILPDCLWDHECLIKNGTTSIVFRWTKNTINDLLNSFELRRFDWNNFRSAVNSYVGSLGISPERQYHLKVRTRYSTLQPHPATTI